MWNWTCSSRRPISRGRSERGIALPGVLLLAAFLVGVTGWLVGHVRTDVALSTELEDALAASRIAEAAVQSVAMALMHQANWAPIDSIALALPCAAPAVALVPLDEPAERAWIQAETDAASRWGPDTPRWRPIWQCHGAGLLGRWPVRGATPSVAVWVADDPEGDAQPLHSSNERVLLVAVARAGQVARGGASATVMRTGPGAPVVLAAWRVSSVP